MMSDKTENKEQKEETAVEEVEAKEAPKKETKERPAAQAAKEPTKGFVPAEEIKPRYIYIRRGSRGQRLPKELLDLSNRVLGASLTPGGDVLRGLDLEEEEEYLPKVIGVSHTHPNFVAEAKRFWENFAVSVPPGDGLKLDITTTASGKPKNVNDWIKWRYAKRSAVVANSPKEYEGNPRAMFYLVDPLEAQAKKREATKLRNLARKEFIRMSEDVRKMTWVLKLVNNDLSPQKLEEEDLVVALEKEVENDPARLLSIMTDAQLENKYFVVESLSVGALQKIGNAIYDGEVKLGDTIEEAAITLFDKSNSETLLRVKEKLKAYS